MTDSAKVPPQPAGQGKSVVSGIGWNLIAVFGEQLSSLVAFVLIARILGPADFGTVILSVALIDIFITFVRSGTSEALIRAPEMNETLVGTGFWLNMGLSIVIAGTLYLLAPTFGAVFDLADTVPLLQTMTLAFPIAAAGAIGEALLARKMAFAAIARRQVIGSFAGAVTAILLAFLGYGVWAMIFQRLVIFSVGAGLSIWAARLVPPMRFSLSAAKEIAHYGGGITSINILYRLQPRATELVIGLLAAPVAVALFRAAYRIVDLVNQLPVQPIMRVLFPTLSRLVHTPEKFKSVLLKFMEALQTILLPLYVGVAYFSADIFHIMFGTKWDGAVPAFVILLIASGLRITFILLGPATSAQGALRRSTLFTLMDVGISIILMVIVAPWGIEAIAGSRVIAVILLWPIAYYTIMRPIGLTFKDIAKTLEKPLIVSILLLLSLWLLDLVYASFGLTLNPILNFVVCALLNAAFVLLAARREIGEIMLVLGLQKSASVMKAARFMRMLP